MDRPGIRDCQLSVHVRVTESYDALCYSVPARQVLARPLTGSSTGQRRAVGNVVMVTARRGHLLLYLPSATDSTHRQTYVRDVVYFSPLSASVVVFFNTRRAVVATTYIRRLARLRLPVMAAAAAAGHEGCGGRLHMMQRSVQAVG